MTARMSEEMSHTKTDEQTGRTGRLVAGFVTALAASAFAFWTGWPADVDGAANAAGGDVKVANSVCEAHELRAAKEDDPSLEIEIPAEFDKQ